MAQQKPAPAANRHLLPRHGRYRHDGMRNDVIAKANSKRNRGIMGARRRILSRCDEVSGPGTSAQYPQSNKESTHRKTK